MESVARAEVSIVYRPTRAELDGALGQKGEAGDHLLRGDGGVTESFWEPDLHSVIVVHGISVVRGESNDKALRIATGLDFAGDFTDVCCSGVEREVAGRGGFQ